MSHRPLNLNKVVSDVFLELKRQFRIFHRCIHHINFILIIVRLSVHLENENGDLTSNPSHKDESTYIHHDDEENLWILRRLHLVATDDEDRVVDADGPNVAPFTRLCLFLSNLNFCIFILKQCIELILIEQAQLVMPPEQLTSIIVVVRW